MEIKKIAIKFGDNDFGMTFKGVLAIFKDSMEWNGGIDMSKEGLLQLINKLSPLTYITHQNTFECNGLETSKEDGNFSTNEEFLHTKKYLQITKTKLLINEEVDQIVEDAKNGKYFTNAECFIYDSTLHNRQIYSI